MHVKHAINLYEMLRNKILRKINFYNQQRKEKVGKLLTNLRDAGLDMTD